MPPAHVAVLEAARQSSQRLICHALDRHQNGQYESLSASNITPDHSDDVKALVQVTTATAVACEAAAALLLLAEQQTHSTTQTPIENKHLAAAAEAKRWLQEAEHLLQHCQEAAAQKRMQSKQYRIAVGDQRDVLERAFEKRQAEYLAASAAARQQMFMSLQKEPLLQVKGTQNASKTWLSTYLSKVEHGRQGSVAADKKPLPAAVYYSIMAATAQHRQDLQQLQMDQHLKQLKERLREDPAKVVAAHHPTAQPKCTALHRLNNLFGMMKHGMAPYHLAMGRHELALAVLESLPWLSRSRSHLQLFEEAEMRALVQQWMQHKQRANSMPMSSSAKAALIVSMSRSARRQLLRSHSRYILAADGCHKHMASSSCHHSESASSSTWKGISWALFPDGLKRELHSLTDRWRSCPDASVMAKQQAGQQHQQRTDSGTASYITEVRTYSTSPYPSFEDMLKEEVQSSISTHNLQRIMTGSRARSSPAAAAGYVAARRQMRA